ncbi:hypothetical protein E2K80_07890 [Rhodophyticola sp. CCM32]|uniref:dynamin family protein n=1 Tax=Rhodophyticola sp. CCM32 TaxID=2916397 RepID=UPI00107FB0F6|nr:dynamin family protein [Rhodophyticola sp. CCM32]QBY00667.1 hypothetical protein E2K80_07890 [Rhodophyticola sp. CCM32]
MKIAPQLKSELDFLQDALGQIDKTVDRKARGNFREIQTALNDWAVKVAVIGQVKAGKSTFLNAFLRQDNLLPSDVNPWTSVVTNIRINIPGDPIAGARFDFFDENDWQEIVDGGSRIRKLTEQLLPGFDTELLRKQSETMKAQAKQRLGSHYETLLGKSHEYDFLTPDLLQRYVCAGPADDEKSDKSALGRYATLTKVANASMRMPEFQVPTIVTDTPGVNDPFLVRDEFTCRSLDNSDVFIVALSAHQPLTDVDIALIRILAKQDNKDVLVFLNRIDELDDYSVEVPRVVADVEHRLRLAIPNIDFAVVVGSAFMANIAMRVDDEAAMLRDTLDTPELSEYLQRKYSHVPKNPIDRLLLGSGLDDVRTALSRVIDNGVGRGQLAKILGDVRAEISATQFVTKQERLSIHSQVESIQGTVAEAAANEIAGEIGKLSEIQSRISELVDNAEEQIESLVSKSWSKLETKLVEQVQTFLGKQDSLVDDRVLRTSLSSDKPRPLEIDLGPLQRIIETDVTRAFEKSRATTDVTLNNCLHACRNLISDTFDESVADIDLSGIPFDDFASTVLLVKKKITLEVVMDRGWKFWARDATPNWPKTIAALRTIATEEMHQPIQKVLLAFNDAQVERASAGMSRIRVMLRMVDAAISDETHRLKRDRTALAKLAGDPEEQRAMAHRLQSKINILDRRMVNLSALEAGLQKPDLSSAA